MLLVDLLVGNNGVTLSLSTSGHPGMWALLWQKKAKSVLGLIQAFQVHSLPSQKIFQEMSKETKNWFYLEVLRRGKEWIRKGESNKVKGEHRNTGFSKGVHNSA